PHPRQPAHRRLSLHIALARVAHFDLPRRLSLFGCQVTQILVIRFRAEGAAQPRQLPTDAAAPTPQPAFPLEAPKLRERGPGTAQRAVPFPPCLWDFAPDDPGTFPEQRHHRHLRYDAQYGRINRGKRIDARIILTYRRLQESQRVKASSRTVETRELRELAHE